MNNSPFSTIIFESLNSIQYSPDMGVNRFLSVLQDLALDYPQEKKYLYDKVTDVVLIDDSAYEEDEEAGQNEGQRYELHHYSLKKGKKEGRSRYGTLTLDLSEYPETTFVSAIITIDGKQEQLMHLGRITYSKTLADLDARQINNTDNEPTTWKEVWKQEEEGPKPGVIKLKDDASISFCRDAYKGRQMKDLKEVCTELTINGKSIKPLLKEDRDMFNEHL